MPILAQTQLQVNAVNLPSIGKTTAEGLVEQVFSAWPRIPTGRFVALLLAPAPPKDKLIASGRALLDRVDFALTSWMAQHAITLLRISLGIVFFWFGVLKFFPGLSPAEHLAIKTTSILTLGIVPPSVSIVVLATWECMIGLGLIFGLYLRATLVLLFLQMLGTLTPIVFFPHELFTHMIYAPTLEGQYIIKNIVLISAGLVLGATVRGGALVAEPQIAQGNRQTRAKAWTGRSGRKNRTLSLEAA